MMSNIELREAREVDICYLCGIILGRNKRINTGPVAQLAEQLTLNGSLPGKPGSEQVPNSGNPSVISAMATPSQALKREGVETKRHPPKASAKAKR